MARRCVKWLSRATTACAMQAVAWSSVVLQATPEAPAGQGLREWHGVFLDAIYVLLLFGARAAKAMALLGAHRSGWCQLARHHKRGCLATTLLVAVSGCARYLWKRGSPTLSSHSYEVKVNGFGVPCTWLLFLAGLSARRGLKGGRRGMPSCDGSSSGVHCCESL